MEGPPPQDREAFIREVRKKGSRKQRARREKGRGIWIDARYESRFSWTLMMLAIGIVLGCLNAWIWVSKERRGD